MSQVIKLMAEDRIHFPPVFACPFMKPRTPVLFGNRTVRIKVPVGLLGQSDLADEGVKVSLKFWVRKSLEGIARSLNDLVNVRVIKRINSPELSCICPGCNLEILDTAR